MQHTVKKPQFSILLMMVSFASVGAVLFTPALPTIQSFFHVTVGQVQLTITSYLVGYALGQLPYGPLANRFGRKQTLYMGISLAIVGSLLCAFSASLKSFELLVFARFLQALGACVGLKISFTMIADVYPQTEATKMISRILISFAIMPGIATAIGGWIVQWINWESCFYFLALFGVFMLWLATRLPETAKSLDPSALNLSSMLHGYGVKFKNKRLMISGLMMGCGSAIIYIFASKSPFIGINLMGLTPAAFGAYNLIPLVGMFLGAFLSTKSAGHYPVITLLFVGIVVSFAMSFTMLIPFLLNILKPATLFFPMLFIYLSESLIFANASSFGLAHAKNKSNGSAVINFVNLSVTVIAVLLSELIYPESTLMLPLSFLLFFGMMLILCFLLKRIDHQDHHSHNLS